MLKHNTLQQLRRTAARLHSPQAAPAFCVSLPVHHQQAHHIRGAARLVCLSATAQADSRAGEPAVRSAAPAAHDSAPALLPVTVLSGFLGAGKTTLLRHVLGSDHGLRIAVLVNDLADVNIDQRLVAAVAANTQGSTVTASGGSADQQLVSLSNGCICCTIREDLIREVRALAEQRAFDYLLVESTGVSLPMPVAATFALAGDGGALSMSDVARLDTLVTVVDAQRFVADVMEAASLQEVGQAVDDEDDRTVADLLVEQVECADVLVLNKSDLVTEQELLQLQELLAKLNPSAKVISTQHGRVHPSELLSTGRFSLENVQTAPGWLQQITAFEQQQQQQQQHGEPTSSSGQSSSNLSGAGSSAHQTDTSTSVQTDSSSRQDPTDNTGRRPQDFASSSSSRDHMQGQSHDHREPGCSDSSHHHHHHHHHGSSAHGISSFVYYARRPFHPQRLMEHALSAQWQGVLRSKGFFWLASRHDVMGLWQSAGGAWQGEPSAIWSAALPQSERPSDLDTANWDSTWGDRCQELVWIGIGMDEGALRTMLDQCLLTDEEMRLGPEGWAQFEDPLPQWLAGDEVEAEEWEEGEQEV